MHDPRLNRCDDYHVGPVKSLGASYSFVDKSSVPRTGQNRAHRMPPYTPTILRLERSLGRAGRPWYALAQISGLPRFSKVRRLKRCSDTSPMRPARFAWLNVEPPAQEPRVDRPGVPIAS